MVNTGTAAQQKKREIKWSATMGRYGLYSSGSLPAPPLSVPPPLVSFPFLHFYIIHITPILMSLSLTLQCSSLCFIPSSVPPSFLSVIPSYLTQFLPTLPPFSRLYLLLSPLFCAAPIRLSFSLLL